MPRDCSHRIAIKAEESITLIGAILACRSLGSHQQNDYLVGEGRHNVGQYGLRSQMETSYNKNT